MQQNWITRIDQNTALYTEYFGTLSSDQFNLKPSNGSWSVGQIIDHVNKLNEDYFVVFSVLKSGNLRVPFLMKTEFLSGFIGDLLLKTIEPERRKKTKTMKPWEPEASVISPNILDQFETNQNKLKQFIVDLREEIDQNSIIHSPISNWITLRLNTAIEMLIQHELRHFNQAKEVLGKLESK